MMPTAELDPSIDSNPFEQALREAYGQILNAHGAAIGTLGAELGRMRAENTMLRMRLSKASTTADQVTECVPVPGCTSSALGCGVVAHKSPSEERSHQSVLLHEQVQAPVHGVRGSATSYAGAVAAPLVESQRVVPNTSDACENSASAALARHGVAGPHPTPSTAGTARDAASCGVAVPLPATATAADDIVEDSAEAVEPGAAIAHRNTLLETRYHDAADVAGPRVLPDHSSPSRAAPARSSSAATTAGDAGAAGTAVSSAVPGMGADDIEEIRTEAVELAAAAAKGNKHLDPTYRNSVERAPCYARGPRVPSNHPSPCVSSESAAPARRVAAAQSPSAGASAAIGDATTVVAAVPLAALTAVAAAEADGIEKINTEVAGTTVATARDNAHLDMRYRGSGDGGQFYVPGRPHAAHYPWARTQHHEHPPPQQQQQQHMGRAPSRYGPPARSDRNSAPVPFILVGDAHSPYPSMEGGSTGPLQPEELPAWRADGLPSFNNAFPTSFDALNGPTHYYSQFRVNSAQYEN